MRLKVTPGETRNSEGESEFMAGKEWVQITSFIPKGFLKPQCIPVESTGAGACNVGSNPGSAACQLGMYEWAIYSWVCFLICKLGTIAPTCEY